MMTVADMQGLCDALEGVRSRDEGCGGDDVTVVVYLFVLLLL